MTTAGNTENKNRLPVRQKSTVGRESHGGLSLLWSVPVGFPLASQNRTCPFFLSRLPWVMGSYITSGNKAWQKQLLVMREDLEAEESGVHISAEIRWLGGAKVRARFPERREGISSAVAAVQGKAASNRLWRYAVRLFGVRYDVDAYKEVRPNASATSVVVGATLPNAVRPQHPSAPSARRIMKRQTTCARLRVARWEYVVRALTERPSAPTAEDLTGHGPTPALPRGRPGGRLGDGRHHPHCDG